MLSFLFVAEIPIKNIGNKAVLQEEIWFFYLVMLIILYCKGKNNCLWIQIKLLTACFPNAIKVLEEWLLFSWPSGLMCAVLAKEFMPYIQVRQANRTSMVMSLALPALPAEI